MIINADFAHAMTNIVDKKDRRKWTEEKLIEQGLFMFYLYALPGC